MHPNKCVTEPDKGDIYFDPDTDRLYKYLSLGDYAPEWVDITPDPTQVKEAANNDGWLFNDYNEIE